MYVGMCNMYNTDSELTLIIHVDSINVALKIVSSVIVFFLFLHAGRER